MPRRLVAIKEDWDTTAAGFRWQVPDLFNMADACCTYWAQKTPDALAILHLHNDGREERWSYRTLEAASNRLAHVLRAHGVKRGDRVAILLPQCPEVILTHLAAYKLGAIALPLFTLFGPDALRFRLSDSGACVAVTDPQNLDKIMEIRADLPSLGAVLTTGAQGAPGLSLSAEMARARDDFNPVQTLADDPAVLIYTSGTTGPPKGALHAHRFLLGHLPAVELHQGLFPQPGDCGWTPADWAWIGGLMDLAMPCLYHGVPLISHRMGKFDPGAAWCLIAGHGVRNLFLPPTALRMMRQESVPADVAIRSISSGGESLGAAILHWGKQALGAEINEIYGQTECNLVVSGAASLGVQKPGTMGRAVPGHEVVILGPDATPLAPGTLGEIAVRAPDPVMFLRYWNKPGETAAKFRGDWLCTGDLGVMDAQGYFTFSGRDDDVITSAGYRIGPSEIENCLCAHADVVMAAVIGVPDPVRTEVVKAFVVLRDGASWDGLEATLISDVRRRISPHVAPRSIERRATLPMTATGKIMRRSLRDEG